MIDVIREFIEQFHDDPIRFVDWTCDNPVVDYVEAAHGVSKTYQTIEYRSDETDYIDTIVAYYVWRTVFMPEQVIAIAVPDAKTKEVVFRKIVELIASLPIKIDFRSNKAQGAVRVDGRTSILVVRSTGNVLRGYTLYLLTVLTRTYDNAAVRNATRELLESAIPTVTSRGTAIVVEGHL